MVYLNNESSASGILASPRTLRSLHGQRESSSWSGSGTPRRTDPPHRPGGLGAGSRLLMSAPPVRPATQPIAHFDPDGMLRMSRVLHDDLVIVSMIGFGRTLWHPRLANAPPSGCGTIHPISPAGWDPSTYDSAHDDAHDTTGEQSGCTPGDGAQVRLQGRPHDVSHDPPIGTQQRIFTQVRRHPTGQVSGSTTGHMAPQVRTQTTCRTMRRMSSRVTRRTPGGTMGHTTSPTAGWGRRFD